MIVPVLALAGSLGRKKLIPATGGSFPVWGLTFTLVLVGTVLIVGALTFSSCSCAGPDHIKRRSLRAKSQALPWPSGFAQAGQIPNKSQCSKIQIPKRTFGHWRLEFWNYLEFVIWDLEFCGRKNPFPF